MMASTGTYRRGIRTTARRGADRRTDATTSAASVPPGTPAIIPPLIVFRSDQLRHRLNRPLLYQAELPYFRTGGIRTLDSRLGVDVVIAGQHTVRPEAAALRGVLRPPFRTATRYANRLFNIILMDPLQHQGDNQALASPRWTESFFKRSFYRLIDRMRAARASSSPASFSRSVARYNRAKTSRFAATSGWSGPRAFSLMASERLK